MAKTPGPSGGAFGERLRELREAAGLSQAELARRTGIAQQSIAVWEAGKSDPGWSKVMKLAEALGVDCRAFQDQPAKVKKSPKRKKG